MSAEENYVQGSGRRLMWRMVEKGLCYQWKIMVEWRWGYPIMVELKG